MIEKLRKRNTVEKCQIKYYQDLDFIDIFDNVEKATKKKNKSITDIGTSDYNVGYFENDKLIRLDQVGAGIPKETHIIWENGKIKEAHEFFLGIRWGKKISNKEQISSSWFYTYENGLTKQIIWINHEDRNYYSHGKMTVTYDYEYDNKGLRLITQTNLGEGKFWKKPETHISYDREKEIFLKTCTISKSSLIAVKSKIPDNVINFKSNNNKTCLCKKCNKQLSFIALFNLLDKRFNIKGIELDSITILYCFRCLEPQSYNIDSLKLPVVSTDSFTENDFKLKRESNSEIIENAFLKIGGQPIWIQDDEHPTCPKCGKTMKFVVEIQTNEELSNNIDTLAFGDDGKLYVFSCCNNITTIPQWY